jgi:solute carrier family 25 carnitine/acylcarnitine transporter 20/29
LYKGATPPAVGWAVIDSVLMGSLHNYRLFLIRHGMTERYKGVDRLSLPGHALSGFCAGLTSAFIATPMEMLKGQLPYLSNSSSSVLTYSTVRLQLQTQRSATDRQFKGPIDLIRKTISTQGVFGLWSGLSGSLLYRSNFLWMFLSFEVCLSFLFCKLDNQYNFR